MSTAYDLSPLYRSVIGVDRMADLAQTAARRDAQAHFPPYNIEKTAEDAYRITLATAGFSAAELEITARPNLLIVAGRKSRSDEGRVFLHRGIDDGVFARRFELANYVVVKSAAYADGVLTIDLAREVPDVLSPRRVDIVAAQPAPGPAGRRDGPAQRWAA